MGRKSKLSEAQWAEVALALSNGESERSVAARYGISGTTLREHMSKVGRLPEVQRVATMIVATESALKSLPISSQITARNLASRLQAISDSLASAAEHGAATAHRLNALANSEVSKVDDANPLSNLDNLRSVGVLTKLANDSASIALNLLAANKEAVQKINNPPPDPEQASPVRPQLTREQWLAHHGVAD